MILYHISPTINRYQILKKGLLKGSGSRSKFFKQYKKVIYVCKKIGDVQSLSRIPFFITHPDFKSGYDIWEIDKKINRVFKDDKLRGGYFIKENIPKKYLRLVTANQ